MRRGVRYLFVMVAITLTALVGPVGPSQAAIPQPQPVPTVASVLPSAGAVVGVAQPVVVTFTAPVADRVAAERSIRVTSPINTPGHFQWVDNNVVQWVPNQYWPAHTHVSVGVQALTSGFDTGDALLGVASLSGHTFTVSRNGEVLRTMPASMGKPSRPTPMGSFTALEKQRTVVMDSRTIGIPLSSPEGYKITAQYAVRVTWSGVYVHSAPWSVDDQGHTNVSHGCINLSPDNAAWYFNQVNVGDPIQVVS
ncbi:MAG: L,D-transpeptidase [Mycobacterium sp.]|uniref:L,D-transpeptidase n=1 Tax=Mycobacterium sp. TaxID=1785 RepID=UPI001EB36C8A|nr:L,D-transpeptidase [Mycobacterium sp.]MBV8790103.1 L,D-transpeptidase [Mycobacterium sp.]